MRFAALTTALLVVAPQPAFAYDDPAVAVCEFAHNLVAAGFKRVSSDIEGASVNITYEISILKTKPKTEIVTCSFKTDENGNFVFDENLETPELKSCGEDIDKANAGEIALSQEKIEECKTVILKYTKSIKQSMLTYIALEGSGIYPIKPEDTALKP